MPDRGSLTILDAMVFDGVHEELVPGGVEVVDGVITAVGAGVSRSTGGVVVRAAGRTMLPGLIDAHFHAYASALTTLEIDASPLSYVALMAASRLRAALGRGFTTVRDVAGGDPGLAKAIEAGLIASPRYLYTGPALSQTGGHGDPRPADLDLCGTHGHTCEVVDGVDHLRRAVRERFRCGAHAIKVMASGGVVSPTDPIRVLQYSPEELRVVAEEAARRGSYVAAHVYPADGVVHAVTNGVRSVEHGNLLDATAAAVMAEHGAFLVPTLVAYDAMDRRGHEVGLSPVSRDKNREVLDAGRHAIEIARAAGVSVGFGSDLMGDLGSEQLVGVRLHGEVDRPVDVLRSLTSVNADLLRRPDLGRVAEGATGDLVIVDGDPLQDLAAVWDSSRRRTVVQSGRLVSP